MKAHLERVHGLAPYLPGQSKSGWVNSQCEVIANRYAEAQLDGDKQRAGHLFNNLQVLLFHHQDILTTGDIRNALQRAEKRLEARNR